MGVFKAVATVHSESGVRGPVLVALRTWASQLTTIARGQGVDAGIPAPQSGPFADPSVIGAWEDAYNLAALRGGIIQTTAWADRTPRLAPSPPWSSLVAVARERHAGAPAVISYLAVQQATWDAINDDWRQAVERNSNLAGAPPDVATRDLLAWLNLASESCRAWWSARLALGPFARPADATVDPETQATPGTTSASPVDPVKIGLALVAGYLLLRRGRR